MLEVAGSVENRVSDRRCGAREELGGVFVEGYPGIAGIRSAA